VRRIRPTTNFHFRSLEEILQRRKARRLPWEDDFAAMAGDAEPEVNLLQKCLATESSPAPENSSGDI
jgi:hypothetical protein